MSDDCVAVSPNTLEDKIVSNGLSALFLFLYLAVIAGWIPTPLYPRRQRWPRWYARLQFLFLVGAVVRLDFTSLNSVSVSKIPKALAECFSLGLNEGLGAEPNVVVSSIIRLVPLLLAYRYRKRAAQVESTLCKQPFWKTVLRNLLLYHLFRWLIQYPAIIHYDCDDDESYSTDEDSYWEGMSLQYNLQRLDVAWRQFHPPHLYWVRISHAIAALPRLLLWTRPTLGEFFAWYFVVQFGFDELGDLIHMISDDEISLRRMEFENDDMCAVDSLIWRDMLVVPMNLLYLVTSFGDPITV